METALHALSDKGKPSAGDAPTPPGFEVIDRVENPVDRAVLLTLTYLIYRIGPIAASMAVLAGAMKSAYALHDFMIMALRLRKYALRGRLAGSLLSKRQGSSILTFLMRPTGNVLPT
jgi:hypothetical protein